MSEISGKAFDEGCPYCTQNEKFMSSLIEICQLKVSTLYLSKEQTYKGRCIVAYNSHATELFDLDKETLQLFSEDVANAAAAIKKCFKPQKINYAAYGDLMPHLHFHLAPKYEGGHCWGRPFDANPDNKVLLNEAEYLEMAEVIKNAL